MLLLYVHTCVPTMYNLLILIIYAVQIGLLVFIMGSYF